MSEEEEFLKLKEELKDVQFAVSGHFNPDDVDIEFLRDLKRFVDFIKTNNKK